MAASSATTSRLLVAVDLEAPSGAALAWARRQAQLEQASVLIVHVVTAAETGSAQELALRAIGSGLAPDALALREARARLESFLEDAGGPRTVPEEVRLEVGAPHERIVAVAQEARVGCIVMGTHGRGRLGHVARGSVACAVMAHAPCRVLTVHDPAAGQGAPR